MQAELGRRDSKQTGLGRRLLRWLAIGIFGAALVFAFVKLEWFRPSASLRTPIAFVGERTKLELDVRDRGSGLKSIEIALEAAGTSYAIASEEFPAIGWRGSGVHEKSFDLEMQPRTAKLPEGSGILVVRALDHSWINFLITRPPIFSQPIEIDYSPPKIEILTLQHYMRLGGSDLVVYRASEDAVSSGVEVDHYRFPGIPGLFPDPRIFAALFAVPQDLSVKAAPKVVAVDQAGNRRETRFFVSVKPVAFKDRTLAIDDEFLQAKVPDLLRVNGMPAHEGDLVQGYLDVNRNLRKTSEQKIREVCGSPEPKPYWTDVFLRQPNSAPLSSFADRRSYTYKGEVIDSQIHLGFDLASLRQSAVTAANDGKVAFADNLGIYGDTVILDHGLGLYSLYGHLSSIAVDAGAVVKRGETLGQTGDTGLAGGDHLHFSMMIRGIHVDPVEWWDPKWIEDHVTGKLTEFAKAKDEPKE